MRQAVSSRSEPDYVVVISRFPDLEFVHFDNTVFANFGNDGTLFRFKPSGGGLMVR